ncbi:MAG: hypothetical protein N4A40_02455 [Tissierellales bacterium]|nr:hypothetical protein [Tissierellales bacterium]
MSEYNVLKAISRVLFPYILIFGLYIIINGDLSPGGGFQGGVVLATSYFLLYFIKGEQILDVKKIFIYEKFLFLLLVVLSTMILFNRSYVGDLRRWMLMILNLIIGFKVALGVGGIIGLFLGEGQV